MLLALGVLAAPPVEAQTGLELTLGPSRVEQGGNTVCVTTQVTLTGGVLASDATVSLDFAHGTTTDGDFIFLHDWRGAGAFPGPAFLTITIPAGRSNGSDCFKVLLSPDNHKDEDDETATITARVDVGDKVLSNAATLTIAANEREDVAKPAPVPAPAPPPATIPEPSTNLELTLGRSSIQSGTNAFCLSTQVALAGDPLASDAIVFLDFAHETTTDWDFIIFHQWMGQGTFPASSFSSITIPAGKSSAAECFQVLVGSDKDWTDETATITAHLTVDNRTSTDSATLTITPHETLGVAPPALAPPPPIAPPVAPPPVVDPGIPEITIAAKAPAVWERERTEFTVTASSAPKDNITINLYAEDTTNTYLHWGDECQSLPDEGPHSITLRAGSTSVDFSLPTMLWRNTVTQHGEITVSVTEGEGYTSGSKSSASVVVYDLDPVGAVTLEASSESIIEGETITFTVHLSYPLPDNPPINQRVRIAITELSRVPRRGAMPAGSAE